jgi:hypothetical protein
MASEVEICNMALSQVRASSINSLDQVPATPQSQQCKLWYAKCRDMMLEDSIWNFARRISALALLADETVFNWRYVYAYPTDCLHITKVIPNIELVRAAEEGDESPTSMRLNDELWQWLAKIPSVPYEVMNNGTTKIIVCNEPDARISYRSRITDVNRFTPQFQIALSSLIASFIAVPLAGVGEGRKLKQDALDSYAGIVNMANINNSNEGYTAEPDSDFVTCRS